MSKTTIDKGFEIYSPYKSKCGNCKHFNLADLNCKAFNDVIPDKFLSGEETHSKVVEGQSGTYIFTPSS